MLVVAVIGILAAIAVPSYLDQVRKGRRSDAVAALSAIQQSQERWRANNASYAAAFSSGGVPDPASTYYNFALTNASATGYAVSATAKAGTSQNSDSGCTVLTVTVTNGNGANTPAACWSK